jgi:hypothetical protein
MFTNCTLVAFAMLSDSEHVLSSGVRSLNRVTRISGGMARLVSLTKGHRRLQEGGPDVKTDLFNRMTGLYYGNSVVPAEAMDEIDRSYEITNKLTQEEAEIMGLLEGDHSYTKKFDALFVDPAADLADGEKLTITTEKLKEFNDFLEKYELSDVWTSEIKYHGEGMDNAKSASQVLEGIGKTILEDGAVDDNEQALWLQMTEIGHLNSDNLKAYDELFLGFKADGLTDTEVVQLQSELTEMAATNVLAIVFIVLFIVCFILLIGTCVGLANK